MAHLVWQILPICDELDERVADLDRGPDGQRAQVDALGGDVLGEVAGADVEALVDHRLDRLERQQGDLAVPVTGVRVALEAAVVHEHAAAAGLLADGLLLGQVHADDLAGARTVMLLLLGMTASSARVPSRTQRPDLPPSLRASATSVMTMPRSTALHMS